MGGRRQALRTEGLLIVCAVLGVLACILLGILIGMLASHERSHVRHDQKAEERLEQIEERVQGYREYAERMGWYKIAQEEAAANAKKETE